MSTAADTLNENQNQVQNTHTASNITKPKLTELNLNILLLLFSQQTSSATLTSTSIATVQRLHDFFYQQLLVSNVLTNLKHFYLTTKRQFQYELGHSTGTDIGVDNILKINKKTQELFENVTHALHMTMGKSKLESFGCEIRMPYVDDYNNNDRNEKYGELMYLERFCSFMLNTFGGLLKSLHFKTSKWTPRNSSFGAVRDRSQEGRVIKDWRFINATNTNTNTWSSISKNPNAKQNKNINNNSNRTSINCVSSFPSNLEELCITNYKCDVYKTLIEKILDGKNKMAKFSLLQINKSQFEDVLYLLNDCKHLIIESINCQRLNQIILKTMYTKVFAYNTFELQHVRCDFKRFTAFLNALADGVTDNCHKNKRLVIKTYLANDQFMIFGFGSELSESKENEQARVEKQTNTMIQFITDCFKFMSKMVEKIDQLLFVIEFDRNLIRKFKCINDLICKIKHTFDSQAQANKLKFKSVISLQCNSTEQTTRPGSKMCIHDTFRMVFESHGYRQNKDFHTNTSKGRLYCCPNCDDDLQ